MVWVKKKKLLLDLGRFNFTHHTLMLGVYSHVLLIVVGYIASLFFPKPEINRNLLFSGWREGRNTDNNATTQLAGENL